MACKTAILASDLPGVRTLVHQDENGYLLIPKNIQDIEDRLTKIMINSDMLKELGKFSRQLAVEKYSWKAIGSELNKLIKNL